MKYKWPDWRVQTYFKKICSPLWDHKLEAQYSYDDDTLQKKYKKVIMNEASSLGKLSVDDLPMLSDRLGLNLLMISDMMHHHFKYVDVVNGTAQKYLDNGEGFIDYNKFQKWWNMSVEELMQKDEKPPAPVETAPPVGTSPAKK
jgi:hypothetical protein